MRELQRSREWGTRGAEEEGTGGESVPAVGDEWKEPMCDEVEDKLGRENCSEEYVHLQGEEEK